MADDTRLSDREWAAGDSNGKVQGFPGAQLAVLMDIRDRLDRICRILECHNFTTLPRAVRKIAVNTTRKPRAKKVA